MRTAIGSIVLGAILVLGNVAIMAAPDKTRRLHCDREQQRCILEADGEDQVIDLSSIEKAHVSHARSSGYSLQLITAKGTRILSKSTMSSESRREYEAAADEINVLVAKRADSLDVRFTHRAGLMPGVVIVFIGFGLVAFGVNALRARETTASPS